MSMNFYRDEKPIAKKAHVCDWCRKRIEIGELYYRQCGKWDGDFFTAKYHIKCLEQIRRAQAESDYDLSLDELREIHDELNKGQGQ